MPAAEARGWTRLPSAMHGYYTARTWKVVMNHLPHHGLRPSVGETEPLVGARGLEPPSLGQGGPLGPLSSCSHFPDLASARSLSPSCLPTLILSRRRLLSWTVSLTDRGLPAMARERADEEQR